MSDDADLPDDRDLRAGEYVLGLGTAAERLAVEREMATDAVLAHAAADWERRLEPWLIAFRPVAPPAELWDRIARSAFGQERVATGAARPDLRARLAAGFVGFALAAGIALAVVVGRPLLVPETPDVPIVALLPKTAEAPVLVVWRDGDGGLLVRSIGTVHAPTDRDYELWSLGATAKRPVALGVLRDGQAVITAGRVPAGPGLLLVSLEARGGSPTGQPQGPVLWSGRITSGS